MTLRTAKEVRALRLTWVVVAVAAVALPFVSLRNDSLLPSELLNTLTAIVCLGGCVLMAAMSLGSELHQRTLTLLLSQPIQRSRLWREKLKVLILTVGSVGVLFGATALWVSWRDPQPALMPGKIDGVVRGWVFLVGAVGSAGFWTLFARSIIGGAAFTFCAQFVQYLAIDLALERWYWPDPVPRLASQTAVVVIGLCYACLFQYLGWRKFMRLEVAELAAGEENAFASRQDGWLGTLTAALLRCRATGPTANLVRKEVFLQKPAFLVTGMFVLCWLAVMGFSWLRPNHGIDSLFDFLISVQVPLVLVLAATTPLGEEKAMGVMAWQLTQPVSARRQWCVKLLVATAIALVLAWGVPVLLTELTVPFFPVGFDEFLRHEGRSVLILIPMSFGILAAGFWASALVANTTRAALTAVVALVGGLLLTYLGVRCANLTGGLEGGLLNWVVLYFQLDPDAPMRWTELYGAVFIWTTLGGIFVGLLVQGFLQFRRAQSEPGALLRYSSLLGALVFGLGFWLGDFSISCTRLIGFGQFSDEVAEALMAMPGVMAETNRGKTRMVTANELAQTGVLSHATQVWLRNASITCSGTAARNPRTGSVLHRVSILSARGREYGYEFQGPPARAPKPGANAPAKPE